MQEPKRLRALSAGAALGAVLWLLSPILVGETEPWDSEGIYYVAGLFLAGAFGAAADPNRFWLAPLGVFLGQAAYLGILFLARPHPLAIIGLVVLAAYSFVPACGSLVTYGIVMVYKRMAKEGGAGF